MRISGHGSDSVAILVFASQTGGELISKWTKGKELLGALTERTLTQARLTNLPFYHYHQELQKGHNFGQRLSNAFQNLYDLGYDRIIAIGNDCPQITSTHILEAQACLAEGDDVIAPATDGGFNLIGIHKNHFDRDTFEQLAWQTGSLFDQTIEYFRQFDTRVSTLSTFGDIDSLADIKRILPKIKCTLRSLYVLLIKVLHSVEHRYHYQATFSVATYQALPFNKGSPLS